MKVKIDDKVYDGYDQPVMVILTDRDKRKISELDVEDEKYCHYPTGMGIDVINTWMNQDGVTNVDSPLVQQLKATMDEDTISLKAQANEIRRLKPALLDMYVCALLAGGHYEEPRLRSVIESAEYLIQERNKRLNAEPKKSDEENERQEAWDKRYDKQPPKFPKKSPVRELREDEANEGTVGGFTK